MELFKSKEAERQSGREPERLKASTFQKNEFRKTRVGQSLNFSTLNQPLKHAVLSSLDDLAVDVALFDTLNVLA